MPQMRQVRSGASVKLRPFRKASKKRGGSKIFNCTRVTAPSLIWMFRAPSPSTRARYLTLMDLLVMGFALLAKGRGIGVKGPEGPHQVGFAHPQPLAEPGGQGRGVGRLLGAVAAGTAAVIRGAKRPAPGMGHRPQAGGPHDHHADIP